MYGESSSLDRQVIRGGSLCGHKIDTSGDIDTIDAGKEDWEFILVFGKWGGDSDSQEKKLDDSVTVVVIGGCESTLTGIRYSTDVTGECSGIYSDTMVREVGIELRRYFLWDAGRRKKTDWSEYKSADSILSGVDLRGVLSGVCNTCDDELYTSNHCHDSIYMAILRVSYSFRQLSGWGEGFRGHVIVTDLRVVHTISEIGLTVLGCASLEGVDRISVQGWEHRVDSNCVDVGGGKSALQDIYVYVRSIERYHRKLTEVTQIELDTLYVLDLAHGIDLDTNGSSLRSQIVSTECQGVRLHWESVTHVDALDFLRRLMWGGDLRSGIMQERCGQGGVGEMIDMIQSVHFVDQTEDGDNSKQRVMIYNDVPHIRAKVAGKKILISEATIRADLLFDDENGVDCFPKQVIWDTLRDIGYEGNLAQLTFSKPLFSPQWKYLIHVLLHCLSPKSTSWEQFGTNIASALVGLATNQRFNFSLLILNGMLGHISNGTTLNYWLLQSKRLFGKEKSNPLIALIVCSKLYGPQLTNVLLLRVD
ncbi:hypothetical protein Tco_1019132 [Tanacetum coccineum]|uniref:Uncharacterized protein n=1 Tax=Tanacetum coccineum TaxID=301880 RepID=A0ABQ5FWC2_9ASTR